MSAALHTPPPPPLRCNEDDDESPSQSTATTQLNKVEPKAYNGASGSRYTVHVRPWITAYSQLESAVCVFFNEGGKPENPDKDPRSREENQHKLDPLMASGPGIEPGPHWWEVSALTTTPSLLPLKRCNAFTPSSLMAKVF